jgi:hypothetical protein
MIVGPTANVLCLPQSFDHLEDRNVGLYARHRAELETPARALA